MKKIRIIVALLWLSASSFAQDSSFRLLKSFSGEIADAAMDNLDNIYILTGTDQLKKYNAAGDSIAVYNNVRKFGKVHSIDVSNPLRVLLYYKDFSSIVILDRLLNVRSSIDLRQNNLLQVGTIGLSYDNNTWVFDEYDHKLKKISDQGSVLMETPDFRVLFDHTVSPSQIIDQNNQVYIYDPVNGLFVFDHYGTFKKRFPVMGWQTVTITDKFILGITNTHSLGAYNIATLLESQYKFPGSFTPYYRYTISNNKLVALSKAGVYIYRIR